MSAKSDDIDRIFWEASQRASDEDRNAYLDSACGTIETSGFGWRSC